jgi:hypothetical protein
MDDTTETLPNSKQSSTPEYWGYSMGLIGTTGVAYRVASLERHDYYEKAQDRFSLTGEVHCSWPKKSKVGSNMKPPALALAVSSNTSEKPASLSRGWEAPEKRSCAFS